jgi:RNA polymerase sigma-70 factor (ECF subfamily)
LDIDDVIRRIGKGDKQAFAEIVMQYQQPIFSFLGRMSLSQAQAEDIAQETFVRAWRHLDGYQPMKAAFSTWLFTIARNLAINELTSARSKNEFSIGEELPDMASEMPEPLQMLSIKQQHFHLQAALRQLNMQDRSVIGLAYVDELSMADIARIEGDSLEAVKTRLHRAKEKLRKLMEKTYAQT